MHNQQNEQLLENIYAAWRDQDLDRIASLFTDDCTYEDMAMGVVFNGNQEVRAFAEEVYTTMPDFNVTYIKKFATDTHGAGQWLIKATWNGEFEGVDCSGKKIEFTGISYYEFADGKVAKAQDCWDYTAMMQQFGVIRDSLKGLA